MEWRSRRRFDGCDCRSRWRLAVAAHSLRRLCRCVPSAGYNAVVDDGTALQLRVPVIDATDRIVAVTSVLASRMEVSPTPRNRPCPSIRHHPILWSLRYRACSQNIENFDHSLSSVDLVCLLEARKQKWHSAFHAPRILRLDEIRHLNADQNLLKPFMFPLLSSF